MALTDYWNTNRNGAGLYGGFASQVGGLSGQYQNKSNPFLTGATANMSWLTSPGAFSEYFGGGYPDINNPQTRADIGKWGGLLNSNLKNATDDFVKRTANAGVAASRGGFGVQGGVDPYASARADQMRTIAGMSRQNVADAMNYMGQAANSRMNLGNQYVDAWRATLGAGTDLYKTDQESARQLLNLQWAATDAEERAALERERLGYDAQKTEGGWAHDKEMYGLSTDEAARVRDWEAAQADLNRGLNRENWQWQSSENALNRGLTKDQWAWQAGENTADRALKQAMQQAEFGEAARGRDWQTTENQAGRQWQSGETALERAQKQAMFDAQLADTAAARDWQTGENTAARDFQGNLARDQWAWQSQENTAARDWQTGDNTAQRAFQEAMQRAQFGENANARSWQTTDNTAGRDLQREMQQQQLAFEQGKLDWQTGENTAARGWQTGENTAQRNFQGTQAELERQSQEAMQRRQFGENALARDFQGGLTRDQWAWQTGENEASRTFTGGQNEAERALRARMFDKQLQDSEAQRLWQTGENTAQRDLTRSQWDWQSSENAANRDWQSGENWANRDWQSGENWANRDYQAREAAASRAWQTGEATASRDWQGGQNTADRAWKTDEAAAGRAHELELAAQSFANQQEWAKTQALIDRGYDASGNPLPEIKATAQDKRMQQFQEEQAKLQLQQQQQAYAREQADRMEMEGYKAAVAGGNQGIWDYTGYDPYGDYMWNMLLNTPNAMGAKVAQPWQRQRSINSNYSNQRSTGVSLR